MRFILSVTTFFLFALNAYATELHGTVTDAQNGELLIGAHISVVHNDSGESRQAASGLDGSYTIRNLEQGNYRLRVSYLGYVTHEAEISVSESDSRIRRDFELRPDEQMLAEVVVMGDNRGTDTQARLLERQAVNVTNIVSARQIQLSPDITVANVIQRVSGLSIERNSSGEPQYAIVRGMDKRYNNTLVNGIKIPSPDNENRFVPLDIFPAVFLERLEVSKSLTADMEADAIGGTVNMVMRDAPFKKFLDADLQFGYNHLNLKDKFATYDRSNLQMRSPREIHGEDYRATPDDFPVENMIMDHKTPLPDLMASATYGNRIFGNRLGIMAGASFQNSYKPVSNYFYDPSVNFREGNPLIMNQLIERETSSQMRRMAVHGKLDFNISENHTIDLYLGKYLLDEFRVRDQVRRESFVSTQNYAVYPITRFSNIYQDITTADLGGTHGLFRNLNLEWNAVYSVAENDRPDDGVFSRAGQFDTDLDQVTNEIVYFQGERNSRAWERNRDNDLSLYVDFTYNLDALSSGSKLKFGGVVRNKERDNYYNYYNYSQIFGQFRGTDWDDFGDVSFASMANPRGSGDRSNLVYDAAEDIYSAYITSILNFSGTQLQLGVRAEQTYQSYEINPLSAASNDTELSQEQEYLNLFPSFSLKLPLSDRTNVKANYYKAISRPGFYEIVPTIRSAGGGDSFYSERGNADLKPSIGHNADLRYEFFPSSVDQLLVGVFYKRIIDPIEYGFPQVQSAEESPRTNRILPQNFDDAVNFGVEFDLTKYFNRFGVRMNYTFTQSEITTNKIVINQDWSRSLVNQTRPLQGQSDHVGNISLLFKDQARQFDAQLVFNYTGERIAFVSPFYEADHYMRPMTQMDVSLEKGFNSGLTLFVKANNLLNTPYQLYVNKPLAVPDDPYPYQTDPTNVGFVRRDLFGQSYRVGIRYNFQSS
ncbi:TonB-dependent receptor [Rhodohalobacter sp. SW132]|uniref:TonB-dependent receptor n=1 Tax=Rhodohalobacter sp. SW132 TaxID=2293433 RepID=UPI000E237067|nr:TonB-dependent receptor [Rhodohalobacter sp. SW132]REL37629.1 TonB-dependent receptor [Rhodohalobacter sp. SW132]